MRIPSLSAFAAALVFVLVTGPAAHAAVIKGYVYDKSNNEQLIGAVVALQPSGAKTSTALDGGFTFKGLAGGSYRLTISFVGYATVDTSINVEDGATKLFNFYLLPASSTLSGVTVTSYGNGESDAFAKRREQAANNIVNVISANSIAISPDITVANVTQRISGISVERSSSGDGQYAIIRGMDKRYNTTLINGVKIPSPDIRNRYVPLDIFPADLVERIEVIKSLTPDMEGDAAGGVINLVMKNAPEKFKAEGNIGTGYSQLFFNRDFYSYSKATVNAKSPAEVLGANAYAPVTAFPYNNLVTTAAKPPVNKNFSLTLGDRFLNNKLGIIFSGSYQNMYRGSNSNVLLQSLTVPAAPDDHTAQQPAVSDVYARQYNSRIDRSGVETKIDYNFNAGNSISLFATYLQLNERRVRITSDSLLGGYHTADDYIGPYAIYYKTETRSDLQSIVNATLQGKNTIIKNLVTDWSLAASEAKRQLPDIAEFSTGSPVNPNTSTGTYTVGAPQTENESREWIHNTDKDLAGYLNFNYAGNIAKHTALFRFGGMYRHKERDNYDNSYDLTPVSDPNSVYQQFVSIPDSKFTFVPANGALGNSAQNPGIYHAYENVAAGYGQLKYYFTSRFEVLGGLRVENTHQNYVSSLNPALPGKTADIRYTDFLPSVQGKYSFTQRRDIRFSYFRSIFRPSFADLIPFPTKSGANDEYLTEGNPYIKHTVIDNFDVRYEIFPKGLDQFMIGAFYKIIDNPIEYGFSYGNNYGAKPILSPQNFGTANNFGIEVVFRKYFGDFGVSGNYTFTKSVINATKLYVYLSPNGNTNYSYVPDRRPLQGQSENIGNFSLLYKSTKYKVDAQLALVYTGERIDILAQYKGFDNWEQPTTNLDFSAQKEFGKHYILYIKANNLLNTPFRLIIKQHNNAYNTTTKLPFQESADYMTVQYDKFYASYLIGFRFKF
ncbi:MAG TPA: TonB-dependent receptor [Chitinophagaceae bacterium]|nr:TonB-dependent receptor [Chitinophagaceae bacterium]